MLAADAFALSGRFKEEQLPLKGTYPDPVVLKSGYIYRVEGQVVCQAGIEVEANGSPVAAICIPAGATLSSTGKNAVSRTAAKAGIGIPVGAKLVVFGDGSLEARGGAGAKGGDGGGASAPGWKGSKEKEGIKASAGGNGGSGGGGGAAGIGGDGGNGGVGGIGGSAVKWYSTESGKRHDAKISGNDGASPPTGQSNVSNDPLPGKGCGYLYVLGSVAVKAVRGNAGASGGGGGSHWRRGKGGNSEAPGERWYAWHHAFNYYAGGGAGGGGGGAGWTAEFDIGGGGRGGGGGGGGGAGGLYYSGEWIVGKPGGGGSGAVSGSSGVDISGEVSTMRESDAKVTSDRKSWGAPPAARAFYGYRENASSPWVVGGKGGVANTIKNLVGGSGDVTFSDVARKKLVGSVRSNVFFSSETQENLYFHYRFLDDVGNEIDRRNCWYGARSQELVTRPEKDGFLFMGYFTGRNGTGEIEYDCTGGPLRVFRHTTDVDLYPSFIRAGDFKPTGITVNGIDAAFLYGPCWTYTAADGVLTLMSMGEESWRREFDVRGSNTVGRVRQIVLKGSGTVRLWDLNLALPSTCSLAAGKGLFEVASGVTNAVIEVAGSNTLAQASGNGSGLVCGGTVTVRSMAGLPGGTLVLAGVGTGAGIAVNGKLTVEDGRLVASGGATDGNGLSGGANYRQTGGTVWLSGGGAADDLGGGAATVTGGSLCLAHRTRSAFPTDGAKTLYCIRTAVPESPGDNTPVVVSNAVGAAGYGTQGIYPIDGRIYLWRPNGYYEFVVDGATAFATVKEADTNAYYVLTGVTVDGENVGMGLGDGWRWSPSSSNLVFRAGYTNQMTVSGIDTNGNVHPVVGSDTRLRFRDLSLFGWGVKDGVVDVTNGTLALTLAGTNVLAGLDRFRGNGLAVHPNAALTIDGNGGLSVTGGVWGAGIGGVWGTGVDGEESRAGTIDIRSGTVTAVGGFEGAGIGGASGVWGGVVNVRDGARVTAQGGFGAAGVGGGAWSDGGGTLTGSVTATGGAHALPTGAGTGDCDRQVAEPGEQGSKGLLVSELGERALRDAVATANAAGGGTVTFATNLSGTVALSSRLVVDAAGPVTIDGGGRIVLTTRGVSRSDGGGAILATRGALVLKGLAFEGFGSSGCGGAVRAEAGLTAEDCTFANCAADEYGGAAYVGRRGAAEFVNCRFTGNAAGLSGGAVYARKRLTAVRCSFDGNCATKGGAAVGAFVPGDRAVAEHCSFLGNVNVLRGGGMDVGAGHAVAAACTLTRNGGGGLYAADGLSAASTLSTGNADTGLWCCPPDAEIGLHTVEFLARACSFGQVAAGTFLDSTVVGLGRDEPFQTDGAVFTKAVGPVQQVYRKLTHRNKRIVQGCAVWHTPGWETAACSPSVNPSVPKTVLYGHSEANDLCATDQLGTPLTTTNLLVGAVTEASERESLVVTTAHDVVDPEDELTSLREAIAHTASVDMPQRMDGYREISVDRALFDANGALTLTATGGTLRIEGGRQPAISGGEDLCTLRLAAAFEGDLFAVAPTNALSFEDLTVGGTTANAGNLAALNVRFEGAPASRPSVVSSGAGRLAFERCTFLGNGGACADVAGRTLGHAVGCTVVSNGTADTAWLFRIGDAAIFDFANCTLADNCVTNAAIVTAASNGTCLVNCALTANGGRDLVTAGAGTFQSACTSYGTASAKLVDISGLTRSGLTAGEAFDGPARAVSRCGVSQAYYRQARRGSIRCTGAYVFHSDSWQALAYGFYRNGDQRVALRDRMDRANFVVVADIVERPIVQGYVSRGSYATCCDEEYFEDGEILVNTPKDFPEHLVEHDYDGLVTLREAVDFACSHPEFRDKFNDCTVRFADRFLDGRASNAVMLVRAQIDVPPGVFSNGTLRVVGRTDGGVIVDGGGNYRIWRTGASNNVGLENLTFRNGVGVAADRTHTCGGALYNLGRTRAANCVFSDCFAGWPSAASAGLAGRASGGAVYTAAGGDTVLERSTLKNCIAGYGGALFTAAEGATTALACTFTGNRAAEGVLVLAPYGGAAVSDGRARTSLVNCTITGNESDGTVGGVAGLGTPGDYTLYLLSSIVTGNRAWNGDRGDADLSCAGSAKVCRSVYGQRGDTSNDQIWKDTDAVGGVAPSNVFTQVTEDGAAVGVDVPYDGVVQTVFPARPSDPATMRGAYARFADSDAWCEAAVWCDKITASPGGTEFWGSRIQWMKARSGRNFCHIDQLGREMSVATLGSTVLSEKYYEFRRTDGTVELFTSRDEAFDAANAAVTLETWYTPRTTGDTVSLVLNAQAAPVIGAATDFGGADGTTVSVWPENVKPNLWYGLGRSDTPVGPFVVEDGAWVRADADGVLHEALTAPKVGPQGFYRVLVR